MYDKIHYKLKKKKSAEIKVFLPGLSFLSPISFYPKTEDLWSMGIFHSRKQIGGGRGEGVDSQRVTKSIY